MCLTRFTSAGQLQPVLDRYSSHDLSNVEVTNPRSYGDTADTGLRGFVPKGDRRAGGGSGTSAAAGAAAAAGSNKGAAWVAGRTSGAGGNPVKKKRRRSGSDDDEDEDDEDEDDEGDADGDGDEEEDESGNAQDVAFNQGFPADPASNTLDQRSMSRDQNRDSHTRMPPPGNSSTQPYPSISPPVPLQPHHHQFAQGAPPASNAMPYSYPYGYQQSPGHPLYSGYPYAQAAAAAAAASSYPGAMGVPNVNPAFGNPLAGFFHPSQQAQAAYAAASHSQSQYGNPLAYMQQQQQSSSGNGFGSGSTPQYAQHQTPQGGERSQSNDYTRITTSPGPMDTSASAQQAAHPQHPTFPQLLQQQSGYGGPSGARGGPSRQDSLDSAMSVSMSATASPRHQGASSTLVHNSSNGNGNGGGRATPTRKPSLQLAMPGQSSSHAHAHAQHPPRRHTQQMKQSSLLLPQQQAESSVRDEPVGEQAPNTGGGGVSLGGDDSEAKGERPSSDDEADARMPRYGNGNGGDSGGFGGEGAAEEGAPLSAPSHSLHAMPFPDPYMTSPSQLFPEIYRSMAQFQASLAAGGPGGAAGAFGMGMSGYSPIGPPMVGGGSAHGFAGAGAGGASRSGEEEDDACDAEAQGVFRWPTMATAGTASDKAGKEEEAVSGGRADATAAGA